MVIERRRAGHHAQGRTRYQRRRQASEKGLVAADVLWLRAVRLASSLAIKMETVSSLPLREGETILPAPAAQNSPAPRYARSRAAPTESRSGAWAAARHVA